MPCSAQGISDMQLFAPADYSTFGTQPHPNEGLFFSFDYMMWSISKPETTSIGTPGHERTVWSGPDVADTFQQGNSHTTGMLKSSFTNGQRYELGRMFKHHGWMVSAYHLNSQTFNRPTGLMEIAFTDHVWGEDGLDHLDGEVGTKGTTIVIEPLPVTFASAKIHNRVRTWGVEVDYILRSRRMHKGGFFELGMGARYLEFNEDFYVEAFGKRTPVDDGTSSSSSSSSSSSTDSTTDDTEEEYTIEGVLADSMWATDANNHIVGPQISLRYFHRYKRWTFSTVGKFFAGYNSQNLYQTGYLGSELGSDDHTGLAPIAMGPSSFTHSETLHEWSPGVEFRFQFDWQVTRYTSLGIGWTGIWLGGIARPSNMIAYELGSTASEASFMGILTEHNRQDVFINGVNFNISFNR